MLFTTPVKKAFIKATQTESAAAKQLTPLQRAGAIGFGYRPPEDNPIKVEFDRIDNFVVTNEKVIAEYPIEDGTFLNDNAVTSPTTIEMDVAFTDTPTSPINPFGGILDTYKGRSEDMVSNLEKIYRINATTSIVADFKAYKNMILHKIIVRRDQNTGFAVSASLSFKENRSSKQRSAAKKQAVSEDVKHTIGVGDSVGLLTLLPLTL